MEAPPDFTSRQQDAQAYLAGAQEVLPGTTIARAGHAPFCLVDTRQRRAATVCSNDAMFISMVVPPDDADHDDAIWFVVRNNEVLVVVEDGRRRIGCQVETPAAV